MELKDISQKEVFRYLGYQNNVADKTTQNIAIECTTELLNCCRMNYTYKTFCCAVENGKVININYIYSLNFRVAKEVLGSSNSILSEIINIEENSIYNTLIVSSPGARKNYNTS